MITANSALLQVASALVICFAGRIKGQRRGLSNCLCEKNAPPGVAFSLTPIRLEWTACRDWIDEDGNDPGCYSGLQDRPLRCSYNMTSASAMTSEKIDALNAIAGGCLQRRRCLSQGRTCDGYWGQWSNNGPCNCTTSRRMQSRYCFKKTSGLHSGEPPVVSIHCLGSGGNFEQNRTISCSTNQECKTVPPIDNVDQPAKPTQFATASISRHDSAPEAIDRSTTSKQENVAGDSVSKLGTKTLIIAGVAVGVAFLAMMMLAVTCLLRRRRERPREKNFSSTQLPPPPLPLDTSYENNTLTSNSIYRPYVHNDAGAYNVPHRAYSTNPSQVRQAVSVHAHHASGSFTPSLDHRGRSATTIARSGCSHISVRNDPPYNTLRQQGASSIRAGDGVYAVPIDHTADGGEEIYWSIDETGLTGTYGSEPTIEQRASD